MTFDIISDLHMQIQTWHAPLRLCIHAKYYFKSGRTNVLKNANKTKIFIFFRFGLPTKANSSDTEAPFLDLNLSIANGIVTSKIYDKQEDFNFEIVNFPFLDGDVPRSPSYGVYISQLIRFARVCSNVDDFKNSK